MEIKLNFSLNNQNKGAFCTLVFYNFRKQRAEFYFSRKKEFIMVKQLNKTKDGLLQLMEKALKKDLVILTEEMLEGHVDGTPRNFYRTYYSFLENKFLFWSR